ncbi:MAG: RNA-binding domain-containing protein [Methylobacter sp.]
MLKAELMEMLAHGENSGVEFKRDDIRPEQLAKEIVALANLQGGRIFLGVEDDGSISGLKQANTQEWVLNVFRDKVYPQLIPFYEELTLDHQKRVAVITIAAGLSKPYMLKHKQREEIYIRLGDRSELATREQQLRLFASGGLLHVEVLPVAGTGLFHLDRQRLHFYLAYIIKDPDIPSTDDEWEKRLLGLGLMTSDGLGNNVCSVAGLVCFANNPRRYLRQSGLRLMVFLGTDKEYQAKLDVILDAPLVGRWVINPEGQKVLDQEGVIEKLSALIKPFISEESAEIDENMRRERQWHYPWEALREAVVNALAHRDWTIAVDIELSVYADRLEIISPGKLQNSMTIEKMIAGQRSPRNPLIMDILRDYAYVDARGMGVRTKIIPLMKTFNQREPLFELTEDYLKTILFRKATADTVHR